VTRLVHRALVFDRGDVAGIAIEITALKTRRMIFRSASLAASSRIELGR